MKRSPQSSKIFRLILLALVALLAIAALAYFWRDNDNRSSTNSTDSDPLTGEAINYGPPTAAEIAAGEQPQAQPTENSPEIGDDNKRKVTPLISTWTQNYQTKNLEVNVFVPTIVENGGACILTLEKQGKKITQSKAAQADAQTTTCGIIEIARSSLSPGKWNAIASYNSATSNGTSSNVEIEIQ